MSVRTCVKMERKVTRKAAGCRQPKTHRNVLAASATGAVAVGIVVVFASGAIVAVLVVPRLALAHVCIVFVACVANTTSAAFPAVLISAPAPGAAGATNAGLGFLLAAGDVASAAPSVTGRTLN